MVAIWKGDECEKEVDREIWKKIWKKKSEKDFKAIIRIIKIQSRTNLNGGELQKDLKEKGGIKNPIQDQPKWWRAGRI